MVECQGRGYFDNVSPRRPVKLPRSDQLDGGPGGAEEAAGDELPDARKLHDLVAKTQKFVLDGGDANMQEYMEARYYHGINCIDMQQHTAPMLEQFHWKSIEFYWLANVIKLTKALE